MSDAFASELRAGEVAAPKSRIMLLSGILLGAYLVLTLWNISGQTIAAPDEPRYADAAREMLRSGDWIVPKFNNAPRLVKPVFFYWELAIAGAIGSALGASLDTAFRFGPGLMGLFTMLGTFLLGCRLRCPRFGLVSAVILMTTFEFHKLSRELVCDMTLTAFLLWSWLFFHIAVERLERQQRAFPALLGFYLCLGLACLTKGPFLVGIFSVVPLLAYLALTGKLKLLGRAGLIWGAPLAMILGLWWSVAIHFRHLDAGSFFVTENLRRFFGAKDHTQNPMPFLFYLQTLGENFAPWVVLIPVAAFWSLREIGVIPASRPSQQSVKQSVLALSDSAKMLLCCLAIPFLVMGISFSKRPLYLLPLYPYLALWVGWLLDSTFLQKEGMNFCTKCAYTLGAGLVALFGGLAIAVGGFSDKLLALLAQWAPKTAADFKPQPAELNMAVVLLVVLAVFGLSAALNLKVGRRMNFMVQLMAMAAALVIGYEAVVVPVRERDEDRVRFFATVRERVQDRALVTFEDSQNEAVWYLDRPAEIRQLRRPDLKDWFAKPVALLLAPTDKPGHELDSRFLAAVNVVGPEIQRGNVTYILAEPKPGHSPDPALFEPKPSSGKHHQQQVDDQGDE